MDLTGKKISHYKILAEIGRGGMGIVYKAEDTRLKRQVALKFLPPELTRDPDAKQRFVREAQAASALEHSNICNIHEVDETDDGQTFIVMACYEGVTLKQKVESGPLRIDEAIEIALQIADGLDAAHENDIVHRDIKSANIIITTKGQVKILDFGLAKLKGSTQLTKTGATLGTAAYMSPEQARGQKVDSRTDTWSLGVILYQMIAGQLPFKGDYEQAMVFSVLNDEPEPLTGLRTGVSIDLEKIVNKCLEKKADDRYQHVTDLIVDLRQVRNGYDTEGSRPGQRARKRTFLMPAGIALLLILVIGYFAVKGVLFDRSTSPTGSIEQRWENSIAVLPFENISPDPDQEFFCDGMTEQIITNISQISQLKVISRTSVMKFKKSEQILPEIASLLNVKYILEGSVRKSQDRIRVTAQLIHAEDDFHVWSEDYDAELDDVFDVQDDISEKIAQALLSQFPKGGTGELQSRTTTHVEAYEYWLRGKYHHENRYIVTYDEESFKLSESMLMKAVQLDSSWAIPYTTLADLYHSYYIRTQDDSKKSEIFRRINDTLDDAFRLDSTQAYNHLVKGRIHAIDNDVTNEFKHFSKAYELNPNIGWYAREYGGFLIRRGLYPQAIPYISRAIELDPLVPSYYLSRGFSYHYMGRFEQAEEDYKKALEIEPDHLDGIERYIDLLIDQARVEEAEEWLKSTKDKELHPLYRAKVFASRGDKEQALALIAPGENLQIYSLLGMREEAITLLENTLDSHKQVENSYYWLYKTNPVYDNIRRDPRFQEYLSEHRKIYKNLMKKYGG